MRIRSAVQALALGLLLVAAPSASRAQIGIGVSIRIGPPALPVYAQPPCPVDGYLWTPGYWAYGDFGYYWVPGVWVAPPRVGFLWTPGYWGFAGGLYGWHAGYWGPHVGFYGGVNYGFGYGGVGFIGGGWSGNVFRYNTAVVNVNRTVVRNVYVDRTVINNTTVVNRASFNGPGGIGARPSQQEESFAREQHVAATSNQVSHEQGARNDPNQRASVNGGRPATAAMDRPGGRQFGQQGHVGPAAAPAAHANAMAPRPNAERPNAVNAARPQQAHAAPQAREAPRAQPRAAEPQHNRPAERPQAKEGGRGEHKP